MIREKYALGDLIWNSYGEKPFAAFEIWKFSTLSINCIFPTLWGSTIHRRDARSLFSKTREEDANLVENIPYEKINWHKYLKSKH